MQIHRAESATSALFFSLLFTVVACASAQEDTKPVTPRDTLLFKDGEKLIGELQRSTGESVIFKSVMAGLVTITWDKIQDLTTGESFAVVPKGTKLRVDDTRGEILQGKVSAQSGTITVRPGSANPERLAISQTADLVDQTAFDEAVLTRPAWYRNWKGAATVGLAAVHATQQSQSYTSSANFARDVPGESWMEPESRIILGFNSAYGKISQTGSATIKTNIIHGQAERDQYFSPRAYWFLDSQFDHDYSQGLHLKQIYAAGVGLSVIKTKEEQLDLRFGTGYEAQRFFDGRGNQDLVGSLFSESYARTWRGKKGPVLRQNMTANPTWSNLQAYSLTGDITLVVPVFQHWAFSTGIIDTYQNNPSLGFLKNSIQITSGITLTIR